MPGSDEASTDRPGTCFGGHGVVKAADYEMLVRSEKLYRHLVEDSLGLICSHDFDGVLLSVNAAACDALGYQPPDLVGLNLRDLMPEERQDRFGIYLDRIRRYGRARGYLDLNTRGGETVTWQYRNQVYSEEGTSPIVIGHAQDVTWRLHMERSMRETNEHFRGLFEDAPVAYHEIDSRGVITRVNRSECLLLGRSKEELVGAHVWDLVAPEQRVESMEQVKRKLAGEQPLVPFLREYVRKDGTRVSLNIHEKLIRNNDGAIVGIRSTLLDVTAQLHVESELRRLNAELDRRVAERTAELNASNERLKEFVYSVSHDLQEPLRSISAFATLLRTRYGATFDADGLEFLDYVSGGAARMSSLIRDLLAYSRILHDHSPLSEEVDLGEVVSTVMENLTSAIDASSAVIVVSQLPTVRASGHRMAQLFQNLLSNAIKYRGEQPPQIEVYATLTESIWTVTVADNGIGVAEEDRQRIFGLFRRSYGGTVKGSGVGLAICQAIVEGHGGRIWVEPRAEGGSLFRFTIPALQQEDTK